MVTFPSFVESNTYTNFIELSSSGTLQTLFSNGYIIVEIISMSNVGNYIVKLLKNIGHDNRNVSNTFIIHHTVPLEIVGNIHIRESQLFSLN